MFILFHLLCVLPSCFGLDSRRGMDSDSKRQRILAPRTNAIKGWVQTKYFSGIDCNGGSPSSISYLSMGLCQPGTPSGWVYRQLSSMTNGYFNYATTSYSDSSCTRISTTKPNVVDATVSPGKVETCVPLTNDPFGMAKSTQTSFSSTPIYPSASFLGVGYSLSTSPSCNAMGTSSYVLLNPKNSVGGLSCITVPNLPTTAPQYFKISCEKSSSSPTVKQYNNMQCSGYGTPVDEGVLSAALYAGPPICSYNSKLGGYTQLLTCVSSVGTGSASGSGATASSSSAGASTSGKASTWGNSAIIAICIAILCFIVLTVAICRRRYFQRFQNNTIRASSFYSDKSMSGSSSTGSSPTAPQFGETIARDVIPDVAKKTDPTSSTASNEAALQSASI